MTGHRFVFDDGGRAQAGFKGAPRDCVVRAIAIAAERPYAEIYAQLSEHCRAWMPRHWKAVGQRLVSARGGVPREIYQPYIFGLGFRWVGIMRIGTGTTIHLRAHELPPGRLIVRLSRHLTAVVDGVIHDRFDPGPERCVYGYFVKEDS